MDTQTILFGLIRSVICEEKPSDLLLSACTPERLEKVCRLAKHHDLAHILGHGLSQLPIPACDPLTACKQAAMAAAVRDIRREHTFSQLCETLEQSGYPYIPLKGAVLCAWYPCPWMRTSCDIDILVREKDLEPISKRLVDTCGYQRQKKTSHDVSLYTPEGVYVELHYSTIEDSVSPQSHKILEKIWDVAQPAEAGSCHMVIPDSLFYYYHMAHMAKHFVGGGCGIRPFLDVWILNHKVPHDPQKRQQLLREGGLLPFARAAEKLSRIWFSGETADPALSAMEDYILSGGTYGSLENRVAVNQQKRGGKFRYAMSRIFLPYDILKYHYPILVKNKWLLPVCQVARWFKLLFCKGIGRSVQELQQNASVSADERAAIQRLLEYLDL